MNNDELHKGFENVPISYDVLLYPQQMNEDYLEHLKNNVVNELEGKCYRDYGYIKKVYALIEWEKKTIISENIQSAQGYTVRFSCLLYMPIVGKVIICKMNMLDEKLRTAINGPMEIIIPKNDIDNNIFLISSNNHQVYIKATQTLLNKGTFVKVLVGKVMFSDRDTKIIVLGRLLGIPTNEEVREHYIDELFVEDVMNEEY